MCIYLIAISKSCKNIRPLFKTNKICIIIAEIDAYLRMCM